MQKALWPNIVKRDKATGVKVTAVKKVLKGVPRLLSHPVTSFRLIARRLFPIGIVLNDPEVYNVLGGWTFGRAERKPLKEVFEGIEMVDVSLPRAFDRDLETSATILESANLSAIVKHTSRKNILEIGTFDGNTSLSLAANSPDDATIVTVDLPADWNGTLQLDVPPNFLNATNRHAINQINQSVGYAQNAYAHKVRQVYGDSAEIDWHQLGGPFDFIFIDGCHAYSYVKSDTANAMKVLSSNGIIVWHDYGMIEEVSRAVDEISDHIRVVALPGTRLAIGFPR
jgi:predicted O-methyltransferase YrrM